MARNILKSSIENASFSIVFQVLFRCITFILNAYIIRTVGQEVLGIMNVRLLLLESTILFLSKEPILKACLTNTSTINWAQVINQIWLSVPLSSVINITLVYVWINILTPTDDKYQHQYELGCYAVALSCIVEQVSQVVVLVAQNFCFVRLKVVIDTLYVVSRTIIFVYYVETEPEYPINAFSIAQIVSSVILCLSYYGFFLWYIPALNKVKEIKKKEKNAEKNIFSDMTDFPFTSFIQLFPGIMENKEAMLDSKLCVLTMSFIKQSVVKQVLTEGERYVMTVSPVLTFSQQSVYDIVNNLGSLAARFIFRPIEESAYFYFTQMIKRDEILTKQNKKQVAESAEVLSQLCKIVVTIGLVVVTFGQAYSYSFLYLYGGQKLVENNLSVVLLRFHSFAIVLLAINGVTEGYVFATMNNQQLDRYNYLMVIFSVMFLLISYILTYIFGPVGFILANCINMTARIVHSLNYIHKQFQDTEFTPLDGLIPGKKFLITLVLSGIVTILSEIYLLEKSIFIHIGAGAVFFLITVSIWALDNMTLLRLGLEKYKSRKSSFVKQD
ncbi:protein RFT1 homolog isoform X1 [Diorhabda carinulata]|uniref:protein RFT1 homolog isoform X1 n=1 Tax=Diorhabda carinulata TaxID=1163345 RepID=UPI0025A0F76F|nr:protein RFT1 homolog isoform X1 [Diorhabda carinulata]